MRDASDRVAALRALSDVDVVHALAAASRAHDPILANVLATEAENRMRRAGVAAARAPECIITIDVEGKVIYVNDAAVSLLGCARDELVGRIAWEAIDVFDLEGAMMEKDSRPSWHAVHHAENARGEVEVRCRNGERIRCVYLAAPIVRGGGIEGAVVVFHRAA